MSKWRQIALAGLVFVLFAIPCVGVAQFGQLTWTPPAAGGFSGIGDVYSTSPVGAWSLRAYNAAYATGSNPSFDYSCTGGSTPTGTINILTTGYYDAATLSTNCGANAVLATKWYCQIGGCLMGNITFASGQRPTLSASATPGSKATWLFTSGTTTCGSTASFTWGTGAPATMIGYSKSTDSATQEWTLAGPGVATFLGYKATADTAWVSVNGGGSSVTRATTHNSFHSLIGIANAGASASSMSTDGSTTTGTLGTYTNNSPATWTVGSFGSNTCSGAAQFLNGGISEVYVFQSDATASISALATNQTGYW
jgi:hypothetical protein